MMGWVCPRCSRCYAPSTFMCSYCGPAVELSSNCSGRFPGTPEIARTVDRRARERPTPLIEG